MQKKASGGRPNYGNESKARYGKIPDHLAEITTRTKEFMLWRRQQIALSLLDEAAKVKTLKEAKTITKQASRILRLVFKKMGYTV